MKKETIITAIVFFGVGFLAGYIFDAQKNSNLQRTGAAAIPEVHSPAPIDRNGVTQGGSSGDAAPALPPGHPLVDDAAMIRLLQEEAAQNPKDPGPPLRLADFLYDKHQFQEAVEWYAKALALDPSNVNARTDLGTAYFSLGRTQESLQEFRKSLEIDPNHGPTLFNIIVVNLDGTHDLDAAQQAWDRLHKLNPNYKGLDSLKQSLDAARAAAHSTGAPR